MKKLYPNLYFLVCLLLCFSLNSWGQCTNVDFSANVVKGCAPLVVQFSATGAPTGSSYIWDFGGGGVLGSDTITKVFTNPGKYTVRLVVTPPSSPPCTQISKTNYIEVLSTPTPVFSVAPGSILCNGTKSVTFTDNTSGVVDREWIIDGVSFKHASSSLNYTFKSNGYKSVSLKVTNSGGCTGIFNDNKYMHVFDSVPVEFSGDITVTSTKTTCVYAPHVGNPGSGRIITGYQWYFPGGSPSSYTGKIPPTVTYNNPTGYYNSTLVITMADGCSYTCTRKNYIQPFIRLSTLKDTVCINTLFSITNLANNNGRNHWEFNIPNGDLDPTSTPTNQKVKYNSAGTFGMKYSFTYAPQVADTTTLPTYYRTYVNYPIFINVLGPAAAFSSADRYLCYTTDIVHLDNTSNRFGAPNVKYTFYIIDSSGAVISRISPKNAIGDTSFIPKRGGVFSIALSARSSNGCKDSTFQKNYINVSRPIAGFKADTPTVCAGSYVGFHAIPNPPESPVTSYQYIWTLQHVDSVPLFYSMIGKDMSWQSLFPGQYNVKLEIKNPNCSDVLEKKSYLTVNGIAGYVSTTKPGGCPPTSVHAQANITSKFPKTGAFTYAWKVDPEDGVYIVNPFATSTDIYFNNPGCYTLSFYATDKSKCTSGIKPANFCIGVLGGFDVMPNRCLGDTVAIRSYATSDVQSYKWSIEPKVYAKLIPSDTIREPKIIYYKDTCYTIKCAVTKVVNGEKCTDTTSTKKCMVLPKADFELLTPNLSCAPVIANFLNTSQNTIKGSYWWDFGDGQTLLTKSDSTTHIYEKNNNSGFIVKMVALDSNGCSSDTITRKGSVKIIGPEPFFTMNKKTGCDIARIQFTTLNKNVSRFIMFYDDGSNEDTIPNTSHIYSIDKTDKDSFTFYPLLLSLDKGCLKQVYYKDTITLYRSPKADFKSDIKGGCLPLTVHFTDKSYNARKVWWDLDGDGKYDDSSHNPVFTYNKAGSYPVKLKVVNGGGCYDSIISPGYIDARARPVAGILADRTSICGKGQVSFKDTSHFETFFDVDYGDNTPPSHDTIVPHLYYYDPLRAKTDSEVFSVRLIAGNAYGCSDTAYQIITVFRSPEAGFTQDKSSGCAPLSVTFHDTSRYAASREWDFNNDGKTDAYGSDPVWVFDPGFHTVKLRITSSHGCTDSLIRVHMIDVNAVPVADFTLSDTVACLHSTVKFTDQSTPRVKLVRWKWYFDDLNASSDTSNIENPSFTFHRPGIHTISLVTRDEKGCFDSIARKALYVEDTFPPLNSAILYVTVNSQGGVDIVWNKNKVYDFKKYTLLRTGIAAASIFSSQQVNDTSFTDADAVVDTRNLSYCYAVNTTDICGNVSSPSASHCTIVLHASPNGNSQSLLSWNGYTGWMPSRYNIYRKDSGGSFRLIGSVAGDKTSFTDSLLCDEWYYYYVEARNANGSYYSRSNTDSVRPPYLYQSTPLELYYATVENNSHVKIEWQQALQPNFRQYHIDRYSDAEGWISSLYTTRQTSITDDRAEVNSRSYTYRVSTEDDCGYISAYSNIGTSIYLSSLVKDDKIVLSWTPYSKWSNGVNKYLVQIKGADNKFRTIAETGASQTSYIDDSVYSDIDTAYCYRIIAEEKDINASHSMSNISCAVLSSRIFIPNAFTPGINGKGDGINDTFKVSALAIYNLAGKKNLDFRMRIYNRWGEKVFESTDLNKGWDGRYQGSPAPMGVYVYEVDAAGIDRKTIHLKGNVTLIR